MGPGKPDGTSVANSERTFQLGPLAAMFRSFRYRDFALFWTGNFLSNVGTWMQNLALGWLILVRTNSPFLLGLNGFLGTVPSLVFSLPGGAIADRLNRRKLMLFTQTSMALLDRKSTRLNSSHGYISYAVFCLKKKKKTMTPTKNAITNT